MRQITHLASGCNCRLEKLGRQRFCQCNLVSSVALLKIPSSSYLNTVKRDTNLYLEQEKCFKEKTVIFAVHNFDNLTLVYHITRLKLSETVFSCDGQDGNGLQLEKLGQLFQVVSFSASEKS